MTYRIQRSALTDELTGVRVSAVGTLKRVDADWVILESPGKYSRGETWIPRVNVLAINVLRRLKEGPDRPEQVEPVEEEPVKESPRKPSSP